MLKKRILKKRKGSLEHYLDAAYYTDAYADRLEDVGFYLSEALAHGGPVLELGCGNGRVSLPMAHHGLAVTGVDHARPMLADFKKKLARSPALKVDLHQADIRTVRLRKRYPLVIAPFNTVLHLDEQADIEAFFQTVRTHLKKGGAFICDLSVPSLIDLRRVPEKPLAVPPFVHPNLGRVRYQERFQYDVQKQLLKVNMEFTPDQGKPVSSLLVHRQFFPQEWAAHLHYNGFTVDRMYGAWDGSAPAQDSDVNIYVCGVQA
jgi:SAM-dependent methyltransferase